jgi:hypothetical protein
MLPRTRCGRASGALRGAGATLKDNTSALVVQSHCICRLAPPRRIVNPRWNNFGEYELAIQKKSS